MSDANKVSQGIVLGASIDTVAAQAAGQRLGEAIDHGFTQRMQNWNVGTKIAEKIQQNLSTTISTGAEKQIANLEKRLLGITTSMSRGRFDDTVERQLTRYIELAQRFGQEWHKAMGSEAMAIFRSFTVAAPNPAAAAAAAAATADPNAWKDRYNAVHRAEQHSEREVAQMHADSAATRSQKQRDAMNFVQRAEQHSAAEMAASESAAAAAASRKQRDALNFVHRAQQHSDADMTAEQSRKDADRKARIHRALEMGHHAQQQSDFDTHLDQKFNAFNMMRQMTGQSPVARSLYNRASAGAIDRQMSIMGSQVYHSAEGHSHADAVQDWVKWDKKDFIERRQQKDAVRSLAHQKEQEIQANQDATKKLKDYVGENKKWMKKQGLTTDLPANLLAYEAQEKLDQLRAMEQKKDTKLSKQASHKLRFASQNFAFGIDDAIQSYHYGGLGASIRAASNNMTAIAGMTISNPMIAAASVIALSAASSVVPKLAELYMGHPSTVSDVDLMRSRIGTASSYEVAKAKGSDTVGLSREGILEAIGTQKALTKESEMTLQMTQRKAKEAIQALNSADTAQEGDGLFSMTGRQLTETVRFLSDSGVYGEHSKLKKSHAEIMQKRLEAREKQDMLVAKYEEDLAKEGEKRENRLQDTKSSRAINQALRQGTFGSGADMVAAMEADMNRRIGIIERNGKDPLIQRLAIDQLRTQHADATSDSWEMDRQVREANSHRLANLHHNRQSHYSAMYGYSGDTGRTGRLAAGWDMFNADDDERRRQLGVDRANGNISGADYDVRIGQFTQEHSARKRQFQRDRQRAVEDDLDAINPDRNPLSRQHTMLKRLQEDLKLRTGLSPEEKEQQARAALIAAERRHEEFVVGGKRNFVSHSMVGSAEDEEMHARMTGFFGPSIKRDKHEKDGINDLNKKMDQLLQQLQFEAQMLEQ